jgi:nucleotide-binding universal stress UspA family protein
MAGNRAPRIVVGVDGSDCGTRALRWAVDYAQQTGGRLTAVTAWHHSPVAVGPGLMPPATYDAEAVARAVLKETLDSLDTRDVPVEQVVAEGNAAAVLLERSRDADLLVVGNRGHGGFTGMLLGSVSTHCAHHAHCPVVVVRS